MTHTFLTRSLASLMVAVALLLTPTAVAAESPPAAAEPAFPQIQVTLHPRHVDGAVQALQVELVVQAPDLSAGTALFNMPRLIVSTPTAALPAEAFQVSDADGPVALSQVDLPPTPSSEDREYRVERATRGDVVIRYEVAPRAVDATTRNGPLFDLRRQGGGLMGAGVYFLPVLAVQGPQRIVLDWDLSDAPAGTRGLSSLGEGRQETIGTAQSLPFNFYAVGPLRSSASTDAMFGFYWLDDLDFDVEAVADKTRRIYQAMAEFYGEQGKPYRVFLRKNPYPAGGGTSLARSFMFGIGSDGGTGHADLAELLAHEIAHTWTRLDKAPHAESSWYSEGTAEYYSLRLMRRMGLLDDDAYVAVLNERLESYFTNPYVALSNTAAGEMYWVDGRAQRVPYGRGLLYLLQVDARLKAAGAPGLDDVVHAIIATQRAGGTVDLDGWVALLAETLGPAARDEFEQMRAGRSIDLPVDALGPCFRVATATVRGFELGYDRMNLGMVTGLVAGSKAEAAGLRNGDRILAFTPLDTLRTEPGHTMQLRVRRGDESLAFEYLPRGKPVDTLRFVRTGDTPVAGCGF